MPNTTNSLDPNPWDDATLPEALSQLYDRVNSRTIRQVATSLSDAIEEGGGATSEFIINVTEDSTGHSTVDKTWEEIMAAYNAGMFMRAILTTSYAARPIKTKRDFMSLYNGSSTDSLEFGTIHMDDGYMWFRHAVIARGSSKPWATVTDVRIEWSDCITGA